VQRVRFWDTFEQLELGTISVANVRMLDTIMRWRQPSLHVPIAISHGQTAELDPL
jgi:hypothetical protein